MTNNTYDLHNQAREALGNRNLDEIIEELHFIKSTEAILAKQPGYQSDGEAEEVLEYTARWLGELTMKATK